MPEALTDPKIEIFLKSRRLRLFSGHQLIKEYPVAIGKPNTPTPTGEFSIRAKVMYPGGVFGTRWMEFKPRYGIHGTNNPASISTMASLGCVRMFNHDVDELFNKVRMGTPVKIMGTTVGDDSYSINPNKPVPVTPNPTNPPAGQRSHTVKPGDTLWQIARHYGVTMDQILAVNNIPNPNRLSVGQIIVIP